MSDGRRSSTERSVARIDAAQTRLKGAQERLNLVRKRVKQALERLEAQHQKMVQRFAPQLLASAVTDGKPPNDHLR